MADLPNWTFKVSNDQRLAIATALHVLGMMTNTVAEVFQTQGLEAPNMDSLRGLAEGFAAPPLKGSGGGVHDLTNLKGS